MREVHTEPGQVCRSRIAHRSQVTHPPQRLMDRHDSIDLKAETIYVLEQVRHDVRFDEQRLRRKVDQQQRLGARVAADVMKLHRA